MPPVKGKKNPNMARPANKNGRWKGGKSSDYRRRITNAKDGELVHHKDHNKKNNKKENFKVLKPGNGVTATGKHNKAHPEKGKKNKK